MATASAAAVAPVCAGRLVHKHYGGVQALAGVDLEVHPGEVHALVGENGAGKSTLMKILAGAERPDAGEVLLHGMPTSFRNVGDANAVGISIVFQELSLFGELDVVANIFLMREKRRLGLVSRAAMIRELRPVLEMIGLDVPLDRPVRELALGEQQLVEIAKALLGQMDLLILDEPNSALNAAESERLFRVIERLRGRGVAILYVSHRLEEVFRIADRVTVLRNGRVVTTTTIAETTIEKVVEAMIGRPPAARKVRRHRPSSGADEHALRLRGAAVSGLLEPVDLQVRNGEIVGLAGLEGAGPRVIFELLCGRRDLDAGAVVMPDGGAAPRSIPAAVRRGVAIIPADRRTEGAALRQSVGENVTQVTAGSLGRFGFRLRSSQLRESAQEAMESLRIRASSTTATTRQLSGGNQQKVVLAKWLAAEPDLLLLDDPTRGVDVGSKMEIYEIVAEAADRGAVTLMSTSELPEYALLCDRVLVFYRGRVCGEFSRQGLSEHALLHAMNTGELEA